LPSLTSLPVVNDILKQDALEEGQQLPEDCEDFEELIERAQELKDALDMEICTSHRVYGALREYTAICFL
jgi:hypothetical protein